MKLRRSIIFLLPLLIILVVMYSCKKEPPPAVNNPYNNINRTVKYTCLFALAGIGLGVIAVGVLFFTGGLAAIGIVLQISKFQKHSA